MVALAWIVLAFAFLLTVYWLTCWVCDSASLLLDARRARKTYIGAAGLTRDRRFLDAVIQIGLWRR